MFEITFDDILTLPDKDFNPDMVCIVAGCGGEVGRAIAIAASANNLMTIGLDSNDEEGKKTQKLARDIGGQMIFIETDLASDKDIGYSMDEAAKLGAIKYVANIAEIEGIDSIEDFNIEKYDLIRHAMLRVPLYISELAIPYMKKSSNGIGVIGNLISINKAISTKHEIFCSINDDDLDALSNSISAEEGTIRFFTVHSGSINSLHLWNKFREHKKNNISGENIDRGSTAKKNRLNDVITPIEIANMFILGFSQYSRGLIEGGLFFDGRSF